MVADSLVNAGVRRALGVARRLSQPFVGAPPVNDRGVGLDPEIHALLRLSEATGNPTFDELGPERARKEYRKMASLFDFATLPLARVEDRTIAEGPGGPIQIRVYTPHRGGGPSPALVYFHGGGFVIGDLESHDRTCRYLARRAGVVVIAVDYRRAPDHPFPAAVDDAVAAFRWVAAHADELLVDRDRLAVGGDSAGGNLSAVVCQQLAPDEPRPCFQLLIYPGTDMTRSSESHAALGQGFGLTTPTIDWFVALYLGSSGQERDPRASPLATADLSGLPPAHVVVAGFDPLRDEGEAYARGLMAAGVSTSLRCYGSLIHGFLQMGGAFRACRWATEDIADLLRARLYAPAR